MTFIPHVIDGQESESASGARFASVDPVPGAPGFRRTEGRNGLGQLLLRPRPARPVRRRRRLRIGREGGTFSREFFTEPKAVVMQA